MATKGTLSSALFNQTAKKFGNDVSIIEQEGTGLVPLIENGKIHSEEMTLLLHNLLRPMQQKNIDHLVLGCSHYPYLIPQIKEILGAKINIIDSGFAVAKQTQNILLQHNLLQLQPNNPTHQLYTNSTVNTIENFVKEIPNTNINFLDF